MRFDLPAELLEIRVAVRELCARFPGEYWRGVEPDRYPTEFVTALTESGRLAALIPEEYGSAGLDRTAACVIMEEINASGCNSGACHAQMYTMGTILRHGSAEQKERYLPKIATGELRLQAFGVPSRLRGPTRRRFRRRPSGSSAATSSGARRSGPHARSIPI
jgi:alkylation response protein AidB-like acyl-CoA dehydrogenase